MARTTSSKKAARPNDRAQPDRGLAWKGAVRVVDDRNENGRRAATQAGRHLARRSTDDDMDDFLADEALDDNAAPSPEEMKYVLGDAEYAKWIEVWKGGKEFIGMRQRVLDGHVMSAQEARQFELDKAAYNKAGSMEYKVKVELYRRREARPAIVEWVQRRLLSARQRQAESMRPKMERFQQLKPRVMTGVSDEAERQEFQRLEKELRHVYGDKGLRRKQIKAEKENLMAELEGKEGRTVLEEGQLARLHDQAKRKKDAGQRQHQREKAAAVEKGKRIDTLKQMETRTRQQDEEIARFDADQAEERRRNRKNVASHRTRKKMEQDPQTEKVTDAQKLERIGSLEQLDRKTPEQEEELAQLKVELAKSDRNRERNRDRVRKHREEKRKKTASEAQQSQPSARSTTSDASKQPTQPSTGKEEEEKEKETDPPVQQFANHPLPALTTTAKILHQGWNYLSHAGLGAAAVVRNALREVGSPLRTGMMREQDVRHGGVFRTMGWRFICSDGIVRYKGDESHAAASHYPSRGGRQRQGLLHLRDPLRMV
ncbi:MAG: hypothetical protein M1826_004330 [Phylliscum demangeonii]|nr:MAG: hypothetical protein M1826_004330 [Phylliscum demangeonii]